jgi:tRNA 2-thiouridine synthesizing protein A
MTHATAKVRIDKILDVKGLNCPLPILRTKMALSDLESGQVLHVLATDPHSVVDFRAFSARSGHQLVALVEGPKVFEFYLRRKAETPANPDK